MLMKTEQDQEAKILSDAADLLEKSKWYGHEVQLLPELHCVMSAIYQAGYGCKGELIGGDLVWCDKPAFDAPSRAADRLVKHLGFKSRGEVVLWNDSEGMTKEKVVDALRSAAYG